MLVRRFLFLSALVLAMPLAASAQPGTMPAVTLSTPPDAPWYNTSLPVEQRAAALVSQMTLEEKSQQLVNRANAIPRLGVPAYNWWSEALHGAVIRSPATVFPEPVGLAATFDPELVHQMGTVISTEARVEYNMELRQNQYAGLDFWSPNINIFRDPRWGRGQETYGEDPFLTGLFGVAFVTGLQGDDPNYIKVVATPKHYAVHSGPEPTRHAMDVPISKHDEVDTYLPAFRAAIVDGKAQSAMCAYNRVNAQPACASDFLLTEMLRGAWGFKGYMTSDCGAIRDIYQGHHFTDSLAAAAAVSMKHGVDTDCADFGEGPVAASRAYADAVTQGLLPQATMDESLRRLFTARIRLGMFDPPAMVPWSKLPDGELDSTANRALALRAARESMVLLKNNGLLPLKSSVKRILVVGPLADQVPVLLGNYNNQPSHAVTALDGIKQAFPRAQITYVTGTNFLRNAEAVPTSALKTPEGQPGVKGEYFTSADLSGAASVTKVYPQLDFAFRGPAAGVDAPGARSARFSGTLTPDQQGSYEIGLATPGTKLWLDGRLVLDNTVNQDTQRGPRTVEMALQAGHSYMLRVEQTPSRGTPVRLTWRRITADPQGQAAAAAKNADVVIAVVGITSQLEGEEMNVNLPGFKGGDRTSLDLPKEEEDLLKAMKKTGKKLAVVLMNGSALSVNWAAANADAILDAWYPGEEGGRAIGQTLSGENNPAGRLAVTFYKSVDDLPAFEDYSMANRTYRYFKGKPLYPFGYGLSYTRFAYSGLKLSSASLQAGGNLGVDVTVRNTGKRAGDEVAQLYLSFPAAPGMPIRALRGVKRLTLNAGESRRLHFDLSARDLSNVTSAGDRTVGPGSYRLAVGGGQPGTGVSSITAGFTVTGQSALAP
ncbi:MAG: glycoside hydrolase family 3 C-terminal domain-containing protein [Alphaproteobacteria bacterium]|nr:glycoside hydrolase family 3 C-terminal domain-containing protein [Alphaproteobacteria bacterium]